MNAPIHTPETAYTFGQTLVAAAVVIGMAVGAVAIVAAPFVVAAIVSGAIAGYVASGWTRATPARPVVRARRAPPAGR